MTQSIKEWLAKMTDPRFPFHTLDEGLEIDEDDDSDDDSEGVENEENILNVDPLVGWNKMKYVSEGGRKDKNGNIFGKVWISLQSGGEFR